MNKKRKRLNVLLMLLSILIIAVGGTFFYIKIENSYNVNEDTTVKVMTSCNPIYIATLNILEGVSGVEVENLSQPTTGCLHEYSLTTEDMKNLAKADVLVINGDGMEGYLQDVINAYPNLPIIDASMGLENITSDEALRDLVEENSHFWLSYKSYIAEIDAIQQELAIRFPDEAELIEQNALEYTDKIEKELLPEIEKLSTSLAGKNVVILHEAYEYIAYDLNMSVVGVLDLDEERQVSAGEVAEISDTIEAKNVEILFAEEAYGAEMSELLERQNGVKSVFLQTLVHGSYEKDDYIKVMKANYASIIKTLK